MDFNRLRTRVLGLRQTFRRIKLVVYPPLEAVEIEINSFCNRKCANCPNHNHTRPFQFLDDSAFYRIIDELHEHKFKGRLTFNMFNEPLLDKRLPKFIEYARKALPRVAIYLNTNGDFLALDLYNTLREAGLDYVNVGQYDGRVNDNIGELLDSLSDVERRRLFIRVFDVQQRYVRNMGGLVQLDKNVPLPLREFCMRPFYQICVNYRGKIVLCCMDYLGLVEIADIHDSSLIRVWRRNPKYVYYRLKLAFKDRSHLTLCAVCDNAEQGIPALPPFG